MPLHCHARRLAPSGPAPGVNHNLKPVWSQVRPGPWPGPSILSRFFPPLFCLNLGLLRCHIHEHFVSHAIGPAMKERLRSSHLSRSSSNVSYMAEEGTSRYIRVLRPRDGAWWSRLFTLAAGA